ncbi:pimeloyl-ACP methyl ester carboxylesterase [Ulvibacter sp. MAR_2010_11]|uniref:alpha/beta fold hydrolase n=1 Tax=Ulvibacter sp. MAR_2010_11 TaxID=1250229 RepID=UPI000C2C0B53|nr:alpha/beta hydrolase [Ulvibacter sp. MAR_2010_11]PKA82761.1 pimeloyl-ACP methyl ester carboxylesterase [Ulvibacter sp. MAR_2010_11]
MKLKYQHTSLFYEVSGQGPVMVLIHGFLESATMWKKLVPELAAKYKVVTLDLPGHGASGCLSETHSMEQMADAVRSILQHLKIKDAIIVGHSMGGYVALAYAELYTKEIRSLVLLNSTPAEDSPERKENRTRALEVIEKNRKAFISMAIANLFAEGSQTKYASEIKQLKKEALAFPPEGITAAVKGMRDRKDRTSVLKQFKKNKLMVCATEDPIIPFEVVAVWAKFCETPLKKVKGGHMSHIENKSEIQKILHFIE